MGLDISHDAWQGSYNAFSRWRDFLAEKAGYELIPWPTKYQPTIMIDWGHIEDKNYYGDWDTPPNDPLIFLFAHSDCDGIIKPEHAALIADRLEEMLPVLDEPGVGHIDNYKTTTERFIRGARDAVNNGENLRFF